MLVDVTGYHNKSCDCPDACKVFSYSAEMSYAALSSLSVDNLLRSDTDDLEKKYIEALETKHRVEMQYLKQTVQGLGNVSNTLENFIWTTENYLNFALTRVNMALQKMTDKVLDDMTFVSNKLEGFKQDYQLYLGDNIDFILPVDRFVTDLLHMKNCITKCRTYLSDKKVAKLMFERFFQVTKQMVDSISHTWDIFNISVPIYARIPTQESFWPTKSRREQCHLTYINLQNNTRLLYTTTAAIYAGIEMDWTGDIDLKQKQQIQAYIFQVVLSMPVMSSCMNEYVTTLRGVSNIIDEIKVEVQIVKEGFNFDFFKLQNILASDKEYLVKNITWFNTLRENYALHDLRKIDIAGEINQQKVTAIITTLNDMVNKISLQGFFKLRNEIDVIETQFAGWYDSILTKLSALADYYTNSEIDIIVMDLEVWRQPRAELNSAQIVYSFYRPSDKFSYWPVSRSLSKFIAEHEHIHLLYETIEAYSRTLSDTLYTVEGQLLHAKQTLTDVLTELYTNLQIYDKKSKIDKEFIM